MPPKKKKGKGWKRSTVVSRAGSKGTLSEDSAEAKAEKKKAKPLTKKERENMRKQEKALKEKIIQLRKEADQLLGEMKATEEAAQRKTEKEENEQKKRVNMLTGIVENFKYAKARLLHELNKRREKEIWERYIDTNQMPYPEVNPCMHTHLYLWKGDKSSEHIDFSLPVCDSYIGTFNILEDLIDYPIFASKETVGNWKETRHQWRAEFLNKIEKSCFNMIKNLEGSFERGAGDQAHVFSYEDETKHIQLAMSAWLQEKDSIIPKASPKISFSLLNVHLVMPAAFRNDPFIVRLLFVDDDFLSDTSMTYYSPSGMRMEADMLAEVKRCFDCKLDAKSSVADREREKVRIAKQKVTEAQAAAQMAERSFESFQQKTKINPVTADELSDHPEEQPKKEPGKKKKQRDLAMMLDAGSEVVMSSAFGGKRPKGIFDDGGSSAAKSMMQSEGTQRALDAISMKSGMKKKVQERMKVGRTSNEDEFCSNVFHTRSMVSLSERNRKVVIRKDSELCFEEPEDNESKSEKSEEESEASFDSLELMFGKNNEDEVGCKSIKTLVRNTTILVRENKPRPVSSKSIASATIKFGRKRGKSMSSMKKLLEDSDEIQQTASEIYDTKEDLRQENYMSSLVFTEIPNRRNHVNLRAFYTVGGVHYLDVIHHESQPKILKDGSTVQMFYENLNIKRFDYKYDYHSPRTPPPSDDPDAPIPLDQGLQHLLHVKVPLPKNVVLSANQPFVALWDEENKYWSKQYVYHFEIEFSTNTATFNVGRIWPFAFMLNKFALLPFNKWVMKPKFDVGGVALTITTQSMNFEFIVLNSEVCLSSVEGLTQVSVIEDILGVYMHIHKLVKIMKSRGLNLFTEDDSFLYILDNTAKDVVLEDHTYLSLAMFSDTLEFQSCQWNFDFKRRKLAFQVRECLAYNFELRQRTVVATSLSAFLYKCNDEESLDENKVDDMGFCPDVYSLLEKAFAHANPTSAMNPVQVITVYSLLCRTRAFSYCGFYRKDTTSSSSDTSKKSTKRKGKKPTKQQRGKFGKSAGSRSSQISISLMFNTD